jgi:integrase
MPTCSHLDRTEDQASDNQYSQIQHRRAHEDAPVGTPRDEPPVGQEVDALSRAVERRYEGLILFLAFTGTRIGEAAALRVRNVAEAAGEDRRGVAASSGNDACTPRIRRGGV